MTIVDTVADRYYGDGKAGRIKMAFAFAELLNQEALRARGRRRRHRPVRRAGVQRLHGRGRRVGRRRARARRAGADVQDGGAHLLRLRHQGQRRLEGRRSATSGASTSRSSRRSRRARIDQVSLECYPLARAARADGAARRQGRDGRRDRRRLRRDRDAGGGRRDDRPRAAVRAARAADRLHQLRPGADAPRGRRGQARGAGEGRGAGARERQADDGAVLARADHAARRRSPPRSREQGHAVLDAGRLRRASPARASPSSTRCGRRGTTCRPTRYLRDGGRYRRRRHSCFVVDGGAVAPVPHRAHWQPVEYNALHGGLERWFEPIEAGVVAAPAWRGAAAGARRARVGG